MQYDPVKRVLGNFFNRNIFLRKLFYRLLDLLLLRSWHIRRELRKIRKEGRSVKDILDAGSGFGQYAYFLSRLFPGSRIRGLDIKEEQIADCNNFFSRMGKQDLVSFEFADLTRFHESATADLILSVDVMEHILEDTEVFRNFASALRPGGLLLISTPSDQGGSDVHDEEESSFIDEHVRDGYNRDDITEKLKNAGFSKVQASYSYGWPGKISWKLSMKYPVMMVNLSKALLILLPFYYLITFPFCLILNAMDVRMKHRSGTGLIVMAVR